MAPENHLRGISNNLVARIAKLLDGAGITNVIWGDYLLRRLGVPTVVDDASFVVPDDMISAATSTLLKAGFSDCATYATCPYVDISYRVAPISSSHVHIDQEICIHLFTKSETLWRHELSSFPRLGDVTTPDAKQVGVKRDLERRNQEGHPRGQSQSCFPPELSAVRAPDANRLLEAYILLMARDHDNISTCLWRAMLSYIAEFVEGSGLITLGELESWCQDLYNEMFEEWGSGYVVRELTEKLKQDASLMPPPTREV